MSNKIRNVKTKQPGSKKHSKRTRKNYIFEFNFILILKKQGGNINIITSKDNEFVKHVKKLKEKKYRDICQSYIIEGIKLINEAINENANIKQIVICEDCTKIDVIPKELMYEIAKYECVYVTKKIFDTLTDVVNPQGILAIIEKDINNNEIDYKSDIIVALDDIQDPGNLGTILRTVDSVRIKPNFSVKRHSRCI